jgi:hypothetical protein
MRWKALSLYDLIASLRAHVCSIGESCLYVIAVSPCEIALRELPSEIVSDVSTYDLMILLQSISEIALRAHVCSIDVVRETHASLQLRRRVSGYTYLVSLHRCYQIHGMEGYQSL